MLLRLEHSGVHGHFHLYDPQKEIPPSFPSHGFTLRKSGRALGASSGIGSYRVGIADAIWSYSCPTKVDSNCMKASRCVRIKSGPCARIKSTCSFPTSALISPMLVVGPWKRLSLFSSLRRTSLYQNQL